MPVAIGMIVGCVQEIKNSQDRLVILTGKPGSGKSKLMRELGAMKGWRYINCRDLVTAELLEHVPKARPQEAPAIMGGILGRAGAEVILLDNLQVLFTPILNLDPLELVRQLGRSFTLIVAWPGELAAGKLAYLEPGREQPHWYDAAGLKILELG